MFYKTWTTLKKIWYGQITSCIAEKMRTCKWLTGIGDTKV